MALFLTLDNGSIVARDIGSGNVFFSNPDRILSSIGGDQFAPKNMTTNSARSPLVASSSTAYPGYIAYKCFDGPSGTLWWSTASGNPTGWVKIDLGSGNERACGSYDLRMPSDATTRFPKDWTLEGSNNDSDWTVVDTQAGVTFASGETKNFDCDSPSATPFRYWRINISANNGDANYVEIEEIYLYGLDQLAAAEIPCTPAARAFLDDADASAQRTTLGLGNVTNDAQLKRADGDINGFTEKTSPANNDLLLMEDSAASYAKKKVKIGNLPTGALSGWSIITSNPNPAAAGGRYMANTSGGGFTITLPVSPSANQRIVISDYAGTFDIYNLTVGRNGNKIMGLAEDLVLNLPDVTVTLDYLDATQGWRIV